MAALFDIRHVPFSRHGRFLTLSTMKVDGEAALWLRSVKGGDERPSLGRIARLAFADENGQPAEPRATLSPHRLDIAIGTEGYVTFAIGEGERLHISGTRCSVRFAVTGSRYNYAFRAPDGTECVVSASENLKLVPRAQSGTLTVEGRWRRDRSEDIAITLSGEHFEATLDLAERTIPDASHGTAETALASARLEFESWFARAGSPLAGQEEAHRLAAYILWANTVPAMGLLTRPAIYMSKNHMINIWSWDNAFSALGVAGIDPQLAFDQFAALFDHQDESGLLPDYINDREALFAFTKPPVHGWAILAILRQHPDFLDAAKTAYLRNAIGKQIGYWLTHARSSGDHLPAYFHGNDSGWDNATFFERGGPVVSPDLATFLILATDAMAKLDPGHADDWRVQGETLLNQLIGTLWTGERIIARHPQDWDTPLPGNSLIQFMPMLLGKRLPQDIRAKLVENLKAGAFLTQWGLATESPTSPFYEDDGYWRGPIWAPTTALIIEGLLAQGENDYALEIARRFCTLAAHGGMAENFDARSGNGLRDRAFAWTSAVYLYCTALCQSQVGGKQA